MCRISGPRISAIVIALVGCTGRLPGGVDTSHGGGEGTQAEDNADDTGDPPGCTGASVPDAPAVSEAEMASSMAAVFCMAQVSCDCARRSHETVPSCRHSSNMVYERVRDDAQSMDLTYDGTCLGRLQAAVEALGCDTVDPTQSFADILGAGWCSVYHGARAAGESCTAVANFASNCAQGLACWRGTCTDPCLAEHGTRSNPYGFACPDAEHMDSEKGHCDVPAPVGEACRRPIGCEPGAYCDSVCIGDVCHLECKATGGLDEACVIDDACDDGLCHEGRCVEAPVEGEPCLHDRCGRDFRCVNGTCAPAPSVCALIR